jgi:hypothetical protein
MKAKLHMTRSINSIKRTPAGNDQGYTTFSEDVNRAVNNVAEVASVITALVDEVDNKV